MCGVQLLDVLKEEKCDVVTCCRLFFGNASGIVNCQRSPVGAVVWKCSLCIFFSKGTAPSKTLLHAALSLMPSSPPRCRRSDHERLETEAGGQRFTLIYPGGGVSPPPPSAVCPEAGLAAAIRLIYTAPSPSLTPNINPPRQNSSWVPPENLYQQSLWSVGQWKNSSRLSGLLQYSYFTVCKFLDDTHFDRQGTKL